MHLVKHYLFRVRRLIPAGWVAAAPLRVRNESAIAAQGAKVLTLRLDCSDAGWLGVVCLGPKENSSDCQQFLEIPE